MNITTQQFAEEMLRTYESRTAQDWPIGLLFMSTTGSHLRAFRELRSRMHAAVQADSAARPAFGGMHAEGLLGEFGSGKSHIAYLLLHDSLHGVPDCMVLHTQMTGDRCLPKVLARLLRSARISRAPLSTRPDGTISAFHALRARLNLANPANLGVAEQILKNVAGGLPPAMASEFMGALSALQGADTKALGMAAVLDRWVGSQSDRLAVEAFSALIRLFHSTDVTFRLVILLDELEALQGAATEERSRFVQGLQDLHDDFGGRSPGLPPTFMALFSTPDFWEQAKAILPSLFNEGDRVRCSTRLTGIRPGELYGLVDRYQMLNVLAGRRKTCDPESIQHIAQQVWTRVERNPWHMRSVHEAIRELVAHQD